MVDSDVYYQDDHATIINRDCREVLSSVDFTVAITSPPYNMHLRVNQKRDGYISRGTAASSAHISSKYVDYTKQMNADVSGPNTSALGGYTDDLPMEDYFNMCKSVIDLLLQKARLVFWNVQMVTGNKPALMKLLGHYADNVKEIIIWDKVSVAPALMQSNDGKHEQHLMKSRYEYVIVLAPKSDAITRTFYPLNLDSSGKTDIHGRPEGIDNIWSIRTTNKKVTKGHGIGAVMPLELPLKIIQHFCTPDDVIVDPFMGSGTTIRAAKDLNRKAIGIEIAPNLCEFASKRLAQEVLPL